MGRSTVSNDEFSQPHIAPKGPEFGGPGYVDPPVEDSPVPPPATTAPPPAPSQPSPSLPPTPVGSPAPYQPSQATPAPVVPPGQQAYGYDNRGYQQPPSYVPQPYPYYPPVVPEHPSSVPVLVLGVVGLFFPILSPVAWVMGSKAKKEVQRGAPYRWAATGQIGYVLGIAYSVIMLMFILFGFMLFASAF